MARIKIISAPADYTEKQGKHYPYDTFVGNGSLPETPKISTKIRPIDEEDANSEVERGEIILNPETGTMHKALGKPHSQGGTPVNLSDGSFIFSNYKNLAFSKKQKELFEFKMGGNKMKNNTPAKILEKEIDLKHHNRMIDILQNGGKYDALTNNSAKVMMMKNLEKAGQVAFLQETKKNEQVPDFAQNTSPIYSKDTDQQITQSTQYFQQGGDFTLFPNAKKTYYVYGPNGEILEEKDMTGNTIRMFKNNLPTPEVKKPTTLVQNNQSQNWKLWEGDKLPTFKNKFKVTNAATVDASNIDDYAKKLNYTGKKDVKSFQNWMYNNPQHPEWKQIIDARHSQYGQPLAGEPVDGFFGRRWMDAVNDITVPKQEQSVVQVTPTQPMRTIGTEPQTIVQRKPPMTGEKPGDPNGIVDPKNYNTSLTPWQKLNMAIPFYRAATVRTQYPIRQHQESVIPQFENQNSQPFINENNQGYFNTADLTRTLNPTQASSYLQQLYGNRTSANNQVIGNIQNNNIQIQNKQKEMAANSLNRDADMNRNFDQKFYDNTQLADKHAKDLREAYEQQGINGVNETMTKKLAFDSFLNSQQQYRGKKTYVDKDGIQHYEGQGLYSPQSNFFGYSIKHNPTNIDWSTYQSSQNNNEDTFDGLNKKLDIMYEGADPNVKATAKSKVLGAWLLRQQKQLDVQTPTMSFQKMGGWKPKLRPNKINYYN